MTSSSTTLLKISLRLVVNSATREKDLSWITQHAEPFGIEITVRDDLSMIAVQGPNAQAKAATLLVTPSVRRWKG